MTELLYLKDCYLKEFEAFVTDVWGSRVELDKTAFYVHGGGQPSDTGTLFSGELSFKVLEVKRDQGKIWHILDSGGLKKGDKVKGKIDWARRYKLMRMHTAAHILTKAVQSFYPQALVTGGQLDLEESRDDYSIGEINEESVKMIEEKANEIVRANLPVEIGEMPRQEALKIPSIFKLRDVMPKNIPMIRYVKIGNDHNACGGTHVSTTGEVGRIEITRAINKGKDNKRLYFRVQ
ncbi:MAG: alanyl-tRNA editing protein [Candidatus Diapherotrites archaeon]|nr:alanyl-tRNA editing protein [Candidatus Diapherotrites archaeon]